MNVKSSYFFNARRCLDVDAVSMQLRVTCYLKVILFLTHESFVRVGKVEAFVGVHAKVGSCSENNEQT